MQRTDKKDPKKSPKNDPKKERKKSPASEKRKKSPDNKPKIPIFTKRKSSSPKKTEPSTSAEVHKKPTAKTKPTKEAKPTKETKPTAEAKPTAETKPITETTPIAETKPLEELEETMEDNIQEIVDSNKEPVEPKDLPSSLRKSSKRSIDLPSRKSSEPITPLPPKSVSFPTPDAERLSLGYDRNREVEDDEKLFSDSLIHGLNQAATDKNDDSYKSNIIIPSEFPEVTRGDCSKAHFKSLKRRFKLAKKEKLKMFQEDTKKQRKEIRALKAAEEAKKVWVMKYVDEPVLRDEDMRIKRHLQHTYYHILQLIFFTSAALYMVTSERYYYSRQMVGMFLDDIIMVSHNNTTEATTLRQYKPLRNARVLSDFWAFMENSFLNLLHSDFFDPFNDPFSAESKNKYENHVLGPARIRQVRVTDSNCLVHVDMRRFFTNCYPYYSIFTESTDDIRSDMQNSITATAWVYTPASTLGALSYSGEISRYGGGGFYLDLANDKIEALRMLRELREFNWVSQGTRAVFIDFTIYNANVNLFCFCKIILEFPPVGGILPNSDFHVLKLIRYLTFSDFLVLTLELLYMFTIGFQTYRELVKMYVERQIYFFQGLNYLQLGILLMSYLFASLSIARFVYVRDLLGSVHLEEYKYIVFDTAKELQILLNNAIGVLVFLYWVKLFSLFNFTNNMVRLQRTLGKSLSNMTTFFPIFLTILAAFSLIGYLLFGHQVKEYKSVWDSFLTLTQAFLGEFNYTAIVECNRFNGPIFYIAFVFFVFFVLLNVFIAIINDAYSSIMGVVLPHAPKYGRYIKRGFVNASHCCRSQVKVQKLSFPAKRKFFFQEIKGALIKAGFQEKEIALFFHKYNINYSNFTDERTKFKLMKSLKVKEFETIETSEQYQIDILRERFKDLKEKLEYLDKKLQPVVDKVDIILHRL